MFDKIEDFARSHGLSDEEFDSFLDYLEGNVMDNHVSVSSFIANPFAVIEGNFYVWSAS